MSGPEQSARCELGGRKKSLLRAWFGEGPDAIGEEDLLDFKTFGTSQPFKNVRKGRVIQNIRKARVIQNIRKARVIQNIRKARVIQIIRDAAIK
jgi:hypothetical protein